ncbi:hypothetical protein ACXYMX_05930 [Sporosarcina sp. CAU 1771]
MKRNARLFSVIGIVFVSVYIVLFLSTGLDRVANYNQWYAFLLCVFLSVGGFILSILSIIGERIRVVPYFTVLFSTLLILFTIFVFLLPEAGIPPAIPLFFN